MYEDTIAAIATPPGEGALGIVRLSGPDAKTIAQQLFSKQLRDHRAVLGRVVDPVRGETVDEAMALYFAAPRSYTREDMVEFTCHGGPIPLQKTLEVILRSGARSASPGEFTMRAFLNGRIDLAQAESVLDIIQAKTSAGLRVALQGLEGAFSQRIKALRSSLIEPLAYLTALVDFPEDEVGQQDITDQLQRAREALELLVHNAELGMVYRHGVKVAIVGRPNAGKSSLLNRLLGHDRAIVTPVAGTTRDTLEETANIAGIPFVLTDTAGISETGGLVEQLGVGRSRQAIQFADLALFVLDASLPLTQQDFVIARLLLEKPTIVVANKRDLPPLLTGDELTNTLLQEITAPESFVQWAWVETSALTEDGLDELRETMVKLVLKGQVIADETPLSGNPRHIIALEQAKSHVAAALESCRAGLPADFIAIDLTAAVNALGQITGETVDEDLLDRVFSRFCIGK